MSAQPRDPVIPVNTAVDVELMARAETPLDVGRSAADVYTYLADFSRHPEWAHTYLSVEVPTPGGLRSGSQLLIREKQDLRWDKRPLTTIIDREGPTYATRAEVSALEPNQHIAWRTEYEGGPLDGVRGDWELLLEAVAEAITIVRFRVRLSGQREGFIAYGEDLLRRGYPIDILARQVDRSVHNIRAVLEGRAQR